jgi:AraC-like DNA-binding protein
MISAELELLVRGSAVGTFLALAVALLRTSRGPARGPGILFCLAAASHTFTQITGWERMLGPLVPLVWTLSVAGAGLLWAMTVELFGETRRPVPARYFPASLLVLIGLASLAVAPALMHFVWMAHNAVGGLLIAHALVVIWRDWSNDLVEQRRRLRGPIMFAVAIYGFGVLVAETAGLANAPVEVLSPVAAFTLLTLGLAALGAFVHADPYLFSRASQRRSEDTSLTSEESAAARRLETLMSVERAYRDNSLTIGALAAGIGLPEHRLRRLINQKLGFRNFTSYLNHWRLAEIRTALSDPDQQGVPILTIALDAGFGSVGPFNRAFKQATGVTPTVYRERNLSAAIADTQN